MEIILASQSPRRKELLGRIIGQFKVIPSKVDEESFPQKDPIEFAVAAASAKAQEVGTKYPRALIIAADTVVYLAGRIYGKPKDIAAAKSMLEHLSGTTHRVITAIALYRKQENRLLVDYETSQVTFKLLGNKKIEDYLASSDFLDKAGSYAIQENGDAFVEKLEGDYDNVVGLPVKKVRALLDKFLSPEFSVSIGDLALPNDWGVGTVNQLVVFVPGAVVGDRVRIKITGRKKNYGYGKIIRLEEPSPYRTEPECPHFTVCGGCSFQNILYPKQLELKGNHLVRTLWKLGKIDTQALDREPVVPSPDIYFYRNKMEFAFGGINEELYLGLRPRTSPLESYDKRAVALRKCPIFSPVVEKLFPVFCDFATETGLSAFDPLNQKGFFRNLVLREGKRTAEIMAILVTKCGLPLEFNRLSQRIKENAPEVKSLWWVESDRPSDVIEFEKKRHISGEKVIEETMAGMRFRISPESFFQPNPKAAEGLYTMIVGEAQRMRARRALGLYCGSGSIEIFLSRAAGEVVGIDSEEINIQIAEENCRANNIRNCRFIAGRVENILRDQGLGEFDLLVLDPPRAGISGKGMKLILAMNIPRLIYVSCNPATFARDLNLLQEKGYVLRKLRGFDFFPHTPHIESLGILEK